MPTRQIAAAPFRVGSEESCQCYIKSAPMHAAPERAAWLMAARASFGAQSVVLTAVERAAQGGEPLPKPQPPVGNAVHATARHVTLKCNYEQKCSITGGSRIGGGATGGAIVDPGVATRRLRANAKFNSRCARAHCVHRVPAVGPCMQQSTGWAPWSGVVKGPGGRPPARAPHTVVLTNVQPRKSA